MTGAGIVERIADTQRVPRELQSVTPPFPVKLKIELTAHCDLKCHFCSLTYKPRAKGNMDASVYLKILTDAKASGIRDLGLFWLGEPLIFHKLPDYVAAAKQIGIPYVFVTTNGRMARPDRIRRLIDSGIDSIKFSFNATMRDSYRALTGVDAFDDVLANIRSTWAVRGDRKTPRLYASTVVEKGREEDFAAAHALIGGYVDEHYPLSKYGVQASEHQTARTVESMLPCWSLFTEAHVSYDGHLSACFCDHDSKFYMGDLRTMSLVESWHSAKFIELRTHHLAMDIARTACAGCIAYAHIDSATPKTAA
jgi:pyruvate-formate lyase-activating enzyme